MEFTANERLRFERDGRVTRGTVSAFRFPADIPPFLKPAIDDMTSARTLLSSLGLRAKKQFGQNFLKGSGIGRRLVSASGIEVGETVLEIGAGLGALTVPLAERAKRVVAVERDVKLVGPLRKELLAAGALNVHVVAADILSLDLGRIARRFDGRMTVAGNLPYNISSPVLVQLVASRTFVHRAVLMFQKELADRMLSPPGRKAFGRLTVMVNYCAEVKKIFELPADAFFPKPKIDSTVLEIRFREPLPAAADEPFFFALVAAAFGQRRKMLRNALAGGRLPVTPEMLAHGLRVARISGEQRAETLAVEDFVRLSNALTAAMRGRRPVTDV